MRSKICKICKTEKDASAFHKDSRSKDQLAPRCASCVKEIAYTYRQANKKSLNEKDRLYRQKNRLRTAEKRRDSSLKRRAVLAERHRHFHVISKVCYSCKIEREASCFYQNPSSKDGLDGSCASCKKKSSSAYYHANRDEANQKMKLYHQANREKRLAYLAEYNAKNADELKPKKKAYRELESSKLNRAEYTKKRKQEEPTYRLITNRRSRRSTALRDNRNQTTLQDLGCTVAEWKVYLEKRFDDSMTWDNYGSYWHLDEVIPITAWDLSNPAEQKACFHHFNSQPLEKLANISKSGANRKDYTAEKQEFLMVLRALGEI